MERKTPREFLSVLQNGTKPAEPDLRLVDSLSEQFHLNNGVINKICYKLKVIFLFRENNFYILYNFLLYIYAYIKFMILPVLCAFKHLI